MLTNSTVSSVFGRTGEVIADTGDYNSDQITIDEGIAGVVAPGATLDTALTNLANLVTNNSFTIMLAQNMTAGTLFKIVNNQAYAVTSLDSILPSIDGIILVSGLAGNVTTAGREVNIAYVTTTIPWLSDTTLYLSQTGGLTATVPSALAGDKYSVIVGKSLSGTTSFIFKPTSSCTSR